VAYGTKLGLLSVAFKPNLAGDQHHPSRSCPRHRPTIARCLGGPGVTRDWPHRLGASPLTESVGQGPATVPQPIPPEWHLPAQLAAVDDRGPARDARLRLVPRVLDAEQRPPRACVASSPRASSKQIQTTLRCAAAAAAR